MKPGPSRCRSRPGAGRRAWALALLVAACSGGGGGGGDTPAPPASSLALLAGNVGGAGSADGFGTQARFRSPHGVALDSVGNIYVGDFGNHTIRRISPAGEVTTFAGAAGQPGSVDGVGAAARFDLPKGVAVDAAGNVYVGDWSGYTVRRISPAGAVTTIAGQAGQCGGQDGQGSAATFCFVEGIAVDGAGNVFVSSSSAIRRISPSGAVTTFAGLPLAFGSADGVGTAARFLEAGGLATDAAGNVFVADTGNRTVRAITPAAVVSTLAGTAGAAGSVDGVGAAARFILPYGVAADGAGNVYVADAGSNGSTIRRISPGGAVATLAGMPGQLGSVDGQGTAARFNIPVAAATDAAGNVYVADSQNHAIRRVTPSGLVTTIAGSSGFAGAVDASGAAASFSAPDGIAADAAGNAFVADSNNGTIRRITPAGAVTTLAGDASAPRVSVDGAGSAARFTRPTGLAIDAAGTLYAGDTRCPPFLARPPVDPCSGTIRRISPEGVVTTLAGQPGVWGNVDGPGSTATFGEPRGIAVDSAGTLYVADRSNHTIRRISPAGVVSTLAGSPGSAGNIDGTGAAARFQWPQGIAVDGAGIVYVSDANGAIRRISPDGAVTTLAAAGTLQSAGSLAADEAGNLYVADATDHTVRKLTPAGMFTVVVGVPGQASFAPGALPGKLQSPAGVAVRGSDLFITLSNGVAVVRNRP